MRRWALIALVVAGVAAFLAFAAWTIFATRAMGSWTGGSKVLLETIIGAAVFTGGLTGVLMWLAFYSSRKGFDEPFRPDETPPPTDDPTNDDPAD